MTPFLFSYFSKVAFAGLLFMTPMKGVFVDGKSLSLVAASSQYVDLGNTAFQLTTEASPFSISFYANLSSMSAGSYQIFSNLNGGFGYQIYFFNGGMVIDVRDGTGGGNRVEADFPAISAANTWVLIVCAKDNTATFAGISCDYNGTSQTQTFGMNGSGGASISTANTFIGWRGDMPAGQFYDGLINQMAFWNTNLSPTERTAIYNGGVPINLSTLSFYASKNVSWWQWNNDFVDTHSGNNGTGVNSPTFSANVP